MLKNLVDGMEAPPVRGGGGEVEPLEAPGGDDAGGVPMTEEQVRELFPEDSNVDDLDGE